MVKYKVIYNEFHDEHEVVEAPRFWQSGLSTIFKSPVFSSREHNEAWNYSKIANESGTATAEEIIKLKKGESDE